MHFFSKNKFLIASIIFLLSGCDTLAPERHNANLLMGKNIKEAFEVFGRPMSVDTISNDPKNKYYGQKLYTFTRTGQSYDVNRVVGGGVEIRPGAGPTSVTYYTTTRETEMCIVKLIATREEIINYYDIKGNCGLWNMGFGTTGALHAIGIN